MRRQILVLLLGLATLHHPPFAAGAEAPGRTGRLAFGWATESIVPSKPVAVAGQYHTRITGEAQDPITVTALAIETRDGQVVIDQAVWVSCDLVGIRSKSVERVRSLVAATLPDLDVRKILVSATHTHTAPAITDAEETDLHPYDFAGSWAYRLPADAQNILRTLDYLDFLERQIARAMFVAHRSVARIAGNEDAPGRFRRVDAGRMAAKTDRRKAQEEGGSILFMTD